MDERALRGAKGVEAAAQGQGAGVVPFSFAAASIPGPVPDLALAPASDSRVRVSYGEADARGLPVEAYLVEWTTASSFTKSSETWTLEVEAGPWGLADLQGGGPSRWGRSRRTPWARSRRRTSCRRRSGPCRTSARRA